MKRKAERKGERDIDGKPKQSEVPCGTQSARLSEKVTGTGKRIAQDRHSIGSGTNINNVACFWLGKSYLSILFKIGDKLVRPSECV